MNGKPLAILLVVLALLGGGWHALSKRHRGAWSDAGAGGGKVVDFPLNDVAYVLIKDAAGEVNLERRDDAWTVRERGGYPADFERVSRLLRTLWELKPVQEVRAGASQLPRLELVAPGKGAKAGTLVEFLNGDHKAIAGVLLGKKYLRKGAGGPGFPAGRYVKRVGGERVSLVSATLEEAEPKPERWLERDFVRVEGVKSVAVPAWTFSRDSAASEWKLAGAPPEEKLDPALTVELGGLLASPVFSDVLGPEAKLEDPVIAATIETFDGFRYELRLGKAAAENQPLQVNVTATLPKERPPAPEEKPGDKTRLDADFAAKQKTLAEKLTREQRFSSRIYLVPKSTVETLSRDPAALLAPKAAPAAAEAASPPVSVTTPPVAVPAEPPEASPPPP